MEAGRGRLGGRGGYGRVDRCPSGDYLRPRGPANGAGRAPEIHEATPRHHEQAGVVVHKAIVAGAAIVCVPVALVAYVIVTVAAIMGSAAAQPTDTCVLPNTSAPATVADLSDVQLSHAETVIRTGARRSESDQAIVVALATVAQESRFLNYANNGAGTLRPEQTGVAESLRHPHDAVGHDHGSLGIFQQQYPWWGTIAELMNPQVAAAKFFDALADVPGWEAMTVAGAAQAVQHSAFPDAYAQWEPLARQLVNNDLTGSQPAGSVMLCGPGAALDCPPTGLAVEASLTPDALRVLRCVQQEFGDHSYLGMGERDTDSDHPSGRAVDVMIPNWDTPAGNAHGWEIAEWVVHNAAGLGVDYVIFSQQIWSVGQAGDGWRDYAHPTGRVDLTARHVDHVHVSVFGDAAGADGVAEWTLPLQPGTYTLSSGYGPRTSHTGAGVELHTGLDFAAAAGTPIRAATAGQVTHAGRLGNYGNLVVIQSDNVEHYYAHQQPASLRVAVGQQVPTGYVVGAVGSTGRSTAPHLHFEVRVDGSSIDPVPFLRQRGADPGMPS